MGTMNTLSLWEIGGRGTDGCPPCALTALAKDWLPKSKSDVTSSSPLFSSRVSLSSLFSSWPF
jgi:hypothetical protein